MRKRLTPKEQGEILATLPNIKSPPFALNTTQDKGRTIRVPNVRSNRQRMQVPKS